jgi:hypothetical protein
MKDMYVDNHIRMRFANGVHIIVSVHPTDNSIKVEAYTTDGYGDPHINVMDTKYKFLSSPDEFADFLMAMKMWTPRAEPSEG